MCVCRILICIDGEEYREEYKMRGEESYVFQIRKDFGDYVKKFRFCFMGNYKFKEFKKYEDFKEMVNYQFYVLSIFNFLLGGMQYGRI